LRRRLHFQPLPNPVVLPRREAMVDYRAFDGVTILLVERATGG